MGAARRVVKHGRERRAAARRELREETGIDWSDASGHLEQLRTYTAPTATPSAGMHVVSVAYFAFAPDLPEPVAGSDAYEARWRPTTSTWRSRGWCAVHRTTRRSWPTTTPLSCPTPRTDPGQARVHDARPHFVPSRSPCASCAGSTAAVWGAPPDLGNFRRKVLGTDGFVVPTDTHGTAARQGSGGRPALLYRRGPATDIQPPMLRTATG